MNVIYDLYRQSGSLLTVRTVNGVGSLTVLGLPSLWKFQGPLNVVIFMKLKQVVMDLPLVKLVQAGSEIYFWRTSVNRNNRRMSHNESSRFRVTVACRNLLFLIVMRAQVV